MEINGVMLRAMGEELSIIRKEAALEKEAFPVAAIGRMASTVGSKMLRGAKNVVGAASRSGALGGRVSQVGQKAQGALARGTRAGVNYFGGGSKGMTRLKTVAGGAAMLGAGAGAAGLGAGYMAGRRRQQRY